MRILFIVMASLSLGIAPALAQQERVPTIGDRIVANLESQRNEALSRLALIDAQRLVLLDENAKLKAENEKLKADLEAAKK